MRKGFGGGARRTQADLRSGGRETLRGWAQTLHWALLPEHVNGTKVDRLERQRQQAASGQSVEAGPLVLDAAAKSWMDRQVAHVLDRAADNFVSLLETTNRRLDAAITKQESVNEELQHSTSKGSANDDVVQLLHSLRQEHRLEAAALWDGLADLADHLGADAGRFLQADDQLPKKGVVPDLVATSEAADVGRTHDPGSPVPASARAPQQAACEDELDSAATLSPASPRK